MLSVDSCCVGSSLAVPLSVLLGVSAADNKDIMMYHSAGKRDRDLTPSPYNARWPEGPRAPLSERSEL